jgi:outer membrane immunogenic protein
MKLSKIVTGSVGAGFIALGLATSAHADAYERGPAYVAPFSWTGLYLGGQAGIGWTRIEVNDHAGFDPKFDATHGFVGGIAGYNWQQSFLLLGAEGDINKSSIRGETLVGVGNLADGSIDWFGSVRGRVGVATGPALFFVTGGWAWAGVDHGQTAFGAGFGRGDAQATLNGWTWGGGLEYAWNKYSTIRAEYRHYSFNDANLTMPAPYTPRTFIMKDLDTVSVALTFKLWDDRRAAPLK